MQQYKGEPVLVAWNGTLYPEPLGRGYGAVSIMNNSYEQIASVTLPGDFVVQAAPGTKYASNIDVHEIFITSNGHMLVTANNVTRTDLSSVGGPKNGWVVEAQAYVIDIATNKVVFTWKSLDHLAKIPLKDSLYPLGSEGFDGTSLEKAWGYFHINAFSPYNGGYLISSRYLCSAIAINAAGDVLWRLQGRTGGDFKLGTGAGFCYQHNVRAVPNYPVNNVVTLHMHDNHNSPIENGTTPSSGKSLKVNLSSKQATLNQQYLNHTDPTFATAMGSYQPLPDGNVFMEHGFVPIMEEYSPSGEILTTIQFGVAIPRTGGGYISSVTPTLSYRGFKQPWVGCPTASPALYVQTNGNSSDPIGNPPDTTTLFMSWNGATQVEAWKIYGGIESPSYIETVQKTSFETVVNMPFIAFAQIYPVLKNNTPPDCGQNATSGLIFATGY